MVGRIDRIYKGDKYPPKLRILELEKVHFNYQSFINQLGTD